MIPVFRIAYCFVIIHAISLCYGKSTHESENIFNSGRLNTKIRELTCCSTRISDVNSRMTNPSHPKPDSKSTSYSYFIEISNSTCGLRFTYEDVQLFKSPSPSLSQNSPCSMDSITVLAPNYPIQPVCGELNKNQVNVPVEGGQTVQVLVVTQSTKHYWSILVNQIPCDNIETKPLQKGLEDCGKRPARHGHSYEPNSSDNVNASPFVAVDDKITDSHENVSVCPFGNNYIRCYLDNIMHHKTLGQGNVMDNRIINGQQARRNSWPWQIVLLVKGRHLLCGAALISPSVVISAGHCFAITQRGLNLSDITIAAGVHRLNSPVNIYAQYRHCDRVVIHAQYSDIHSDIALCFLNEPMTISQTVSPVCLPYDTDKDFAGHDAVITGFGKTADNSGPATVLHEASIPIVSNKACQDAWIDVGGQQLAGLIEHSMVCAGGQNTSTCNGDSGGPLTVKLGDRYQLVGLTSFGPSTKCNVPDKPLSVFTRVTSHLKFISLATAKTTSEDMSNIKTYTPCIET